jgi:hypothetical protein
MVFLNEYTTSDIAAREGAAGKTMDSDEEDSGSLFSFSKDGNQPLNLLMPLPAS